MTKNTKNNEPETKVLSKTKAFSALQVATTYIFGVVASVAVLGLASKGISQYLVNLNESARTAASIAIVAMLAYCITSFIKALK